MQTPRKRTSSRTLFKSSAKKRKVTYPSTSSVPRSVGKPSYAAPLKKTLKAQLVYVENFLLQPGLNSTETKLFRANGLFSPSVSGGGGAHQPRGFDQLCTLYSRYQVTNARIEVLPDDEIDGDEPTRGLIATVDLRENTTTTGTLTEQLERVCMNYQMFTQFKTIPATKLCLEANIPQFLGIPAGEDGLKGTPSANPAEQAYFAVNCGLINSGINFGTSTRIRFTVRIIYEAIFSEPIHPAIS